MTNLRDRPSPVSQWRNQKTDDPAWLWWLVAGGSIAAHLLLLSLTLPFSSSLSDASSGSDGNSTPIDLVELPPASPAANPPAKPVPAPAIAAPAANPPAAPASSDIAFAPSVPPVAPAPVPPAGAPASVPQTMPPRSPLPQSDPADLSPSPTIAPELPAGTIDPAPQAENFAPQPAATPPALVPPAAGTPAQNSASTDTPTGRRINLIPIDGAPPDISQTLPIPPTPEQSLDPVETQQQAVPVTLTASLTAADPPADAANLPETIARPLQDSTTFTSDPRSSSCVITPDILPYLGETVAVQVTTNEAGQPIDAAVSQPSRSPVYDDLALCMVKQWQFEPAMTGGVPVASNALVVAVRIQ